MPPKNCGSCQKLVYPMDELKCLDKTWHKACFRCQVCSMTLNMKNYKGYNKLPYCNAHYPTTKFTAVADTPENMRIKKNTKIQSNVKYHAEFEAAKGQYTAVADDPETMRVRKNMTTISNVAYHGEMQRKMEMENARPSEIEASSNGSMRPPATPAAPATRSRQPGSISDYDPAPESRPSPFSSRTQSTTAYTSANGQRQDHPVDDAGVIEDVPVYSRSRRIGSITDYDPINDQYGSIVDQHAASVQPAVSKPAAPVAAPRVASEPVPAPRQPSPPPVRKPSPPPVREPTPPPVREPTPPPVREPTPPPIREPTPPPIREPTPPPVREPTPPPVREPTPPPVREPTPPPVREPTPPPVREPSPPPIREPTPPPIREPTPPPVIPEPAAPAVADEFEGKGNVSKAVYEYTAGDEDEVSFVEGDIIIHCDPIDDGWMNGTVERNGQSGMLPSNYVEKINW